MNNQWGYETVDDFVVQEYVDIFIYGREHPEWGALRKALIEEGYDPAEVWNILTRVREGG